MKRNAGELLLEKKIEDFSANKNEYLSHSFHETSTRSRFIDPFFRALGWDLEQTHLKPHFLLQGLNMVCTIREVNPDEDTWHMCKVRVELIA